MNDEFIDYGQLIDDAMHIIVKKAIERVCKGGLPGKHHFFISFVTDYPGVIISKALQEKYPDEMTIVLQHQFEDLKVNDKGFSVVLSFDNVKECVKVPFDALVAFADPSVKFGLQFRPSEGYEDEYFDETDFSVPGEEEILEKIMDDKPNKGKTKKSKTTKEKKGSKKTNVVDLNSFRKKE